MTFREWLQSIPGEITTDSLWRVEAYRLAMFAAELGWYDVSKLMRDRRTISLADQLYAALGSVSANLAEGYSRGTGRDRARFYEYSLGSARESRDHYYRARHLLGHEVFLHRLNLLTQITKLLLTMIPDQRKMTLRENEIPYLESFDLDALIPIPTQDHE